MSPESPRAVMLTHFYAALGAALASGDLRAARITHEAMGRLLDDATREGGAKLVDLAEERERRRRE